MVGDDLMISNRSALIICFFDDVGDEKSRCILLFSCFNDAVSDVDKSVVVAAAEDGIVDIFFEILQIKKKH